MMATEHRPVMLEEAVAALDPKDGETVVDATFGVEDIRVGSWRSSMPAQGRRHRPGPSGGRAGVGTLRDRRFEFMSGAYDEVLWEMVEEERRVDAVLFDLGLSSYQIDEPERVQLRQGGAAGHADGPSLRHLGCRVLEHCRG